MVNENELEQIKQETGNINYDEDDLEDEEDDENEDGDEEDEEEEGGFLNPKMEKAVTVMGIIAAIVIIGILVFLGGSMLGLFKFGSSGNDTTQEEESGIEVPDLVGMDKDSAKKELNDAGLGFKISTYEYSDEYEEGEIISSDPKAGEFVEENTTISVVVSNGAEDEATVPTLEGLTESNATSKLKSMDIAYKVSYEFNSEVANGVVISQTPSSGSKISDNTTVNLVVSKGQDTLTVPNVVGQDQATAQSTLTSNGLTVGSVSSEYSDSYAAGKVISQSVESGKTVASGTSVDLVISLGAQTKYVTVPSVVGMDQTTAQSTLTASGLKVGMVSSQSSDTVTAGNVISQGTAVGSSVEEGTSVSIIVSTGPAAQTPTTPTDTPAE